MKTWQSIALGLGVAGAIVWVQKRASAMSQPTPARALSVAQALDQMHAYEQQGLVHIVSEDPPGTPNARMVVLGSIAGVQHNYAGTTNRRTIDNLDPRFGVFLVRLDQMLHDRYGVSTMIDAGITHGGDNPLDVHNQGRALDFVGAQGPGLDVNVLRDWGNRPSNGAGYRLSPGDNGYALFADIYQLAAQQGADRSCGTVPVPEIFPSSIGASSCIVTPDHPDPGLRRDHQNHMHLQIGRTIGVEPSA